MQFDLDLSKAVKVQEKEIRESQNSMNRLDDDYDEENNQDSQRDYPKSSSSSQRVSNVPAGLGLGLDLTKAKDLNQQFLNRDSSAKL